MTSLFAVLHPLTVLLALPLVGAVLLLAVRALDDRSVRQIALIFSGVTFLVSLAVFLGTPGGPLAHEGRLVSDEVLLRWIPSLGITYHLKIDGISHFLVLLTTFLTPHQSFGGQGAHAKSGLRHQTDVFALHKPRPRPAMTK